MLMPGRQHKSYTLTKPKTLYFSIQDEGAENTTNLPTSLSWYQSISVGIWAWRVTDLVPASR